jgi:hypothetical protein
MTRQHLANIKNLGLATHQCEHDASVGAKVIYDLDRQWWYLIHNWVGVKQRVLIFHCPFCGVKLDDTLEKTTQMWNIVQRASEIARVIIARLSDVRTDLFMNVAFQIYREQSNLRDFYDYGPMEEAMAYSALAHIFRADEHLDDARKELVEAQQVIGFIKGPTDDG